MPCIFDVESLCSQRLNERISARSVLFENIFVSVTLFAACEFCDQLSSETLLLDFRSEVHLS